jgi:signal peptidase I
MKKYTLEQIREWGESILIAVILALLIRAFIIQAFKIPSGSMIPTFEIGDRIFVSKFIYGARIPFTDIRLPAVRQPARGDIVVFKSTETPKKDFVKRLIAIDGETIEIKDGNIYINGEITDEPKVRSISYYNAGAYGKEGVPITIPKDSYYVLGDNSANSRDSRYWGFVPKRNLIGKAILIYWPIHRMRIIK